MQEEFRQAVIDLYTSFDEMEALYDKFSKHFETIEDHHDRIKKAFAALEKVTSWQKYIKERLDGLPILNKLQLKTTEVAIHTWEGVCDSVEDLIKSGQMICEQRRSNSKNLLTYLSFPILDLINEAPSHQLHLEQVEKWFDDSKELIQQISQLMTQEIEKQIEVPHASIARIILFIKEWKKMTRVEILLQSCKSDIQLRNANFQEVNDILDIFSKWCSSLDQS